MDDRTDNPAERRGLHGLSQLLAFSGLLGLFGLFGLIALKYPVDKARRGGAVRLTGVLGLLGLSGFWIPGAGAAGALGALGLWNHQNPKLAKLAGAPAAPAAGLDFHVKLGDKVEADTPLFTIHSEAPGELQYAIDFLTAHPGALSIEEESI